LPAGLPKITFSVAQQKLIWHNNRLHSRTFCWDTEPLLKKVNVILSLQVIVGFSTQELSAEILSPCWMLFYLYRLLWDSPLKNFLLRSLSPCWMLFYLYMLLWDSPLKNFLLRYWASAECYFISTGYCGILHVQTFCYLFSFLYSFVSWSFLKLPEDNFCLGYQLSGYLSTIVLTT
jgi:hypothetical protein